MNKPKYFFYREIDAIQRPYAQSYATPGHGWRRDKQGKFFRTKEDVRVYCLCSFCSSNLYTSEWDVRDCGACDVKKVLHGHCARCVCMVCMCECVRQTTRNIPINPARYTIIKSPVYECTCLNCQCARGEEKVYHMFSQKPQKFTLWNTDKHLQLIDALAEQKQVELNREFEAKIATKRPPPLENLCMTAGNAKKVILLDEPIKPSEMPIKPIKPSEMFDDDLDLIMSIQN